jgi:hypothetical protein
MSVCTICGSPPRSAAARTLRGELTCVTHPFVATCVFCGRRAGRGEPGWCDLGAGTHRCPTCAREAVDTQDALRRHVPRVRGVTRDLGFGLARRVRVVFGTADDLAGPGPARPFGVTELRITGARTAEVVVVRVLCGLPGFVFGRVVAHELGHAWLAQFASRPTDPAVEEGVCELIAYAWLKRSGTPYAEELREEIRKNPDPVYGNGFRTVQAAVRQHGLAKVLESMSTAGILPPESREVPDDNDLGDEFFSDTGRYAGRSGS